MGCSSATHNTCVMYGLPKLPQSLLLSGHGATVKSQQHLLPQAGQHVGDLCDLDVQASIGQQSRLSAPASSHTAHTCLCVHALEGIVVSNDAAALWAVLISDSCAVGQMAERGEVFFHIQDVGVDVHCLQAEEVKALNR